MGLFWIGGKPGSGKSMLMKRVVHHLTEEKTGNIVASFFIYGQGVPLQKSRMGLYSALIHQLFQPLSTAFQGLIWEFQNRTETRGKYGQKWKWSLEDIRSHFFEALKLGSQTKTIMIFADALDEAGEEEAQEMIHDFDGFLDGLSGSNSKIKVCFSCRHYPDMRLSHTVAVSVEEHNRRDIQMVINDHLKNLTLEERTMLQTDIVSKSRGIFHWATLVADRAVRQRRKGKPLRIVFSTFQEGQADLYQLYGALLRDLEGDDRVQTIRLFQWMLFTKKFLTLRDLQHIMALSHDMAENSISHYSSEKYFTDENDLKARVTDLSRGLVEVNGFGFKWETSDPELFGIQFIHQSVVDYLSESGLQTLEVIQDTTISGSMDVRAHFQLSRSCLRLLLMSEFEDVDRILYDNSEQYSFAPSLLMEDDIDSRSFEPFEMRKRREGLHLPHDVESLLMHCWDYWVVYILEVAKEGHPLPGCYPDYKGLVSKDKTKWEYVPDQYRQYDLLDYFCLPDSNKFLGFCVRFANVWGNSGSLNELRRTFTKIWNVKNVFHGQLAMNVWSFALCGSSLIHFLALSGLKAPFQRMIDSPRASLEVWDREGRTPLMYAILGFAVEIAMDLILAMVDVNAQDIYGNTALHFASFGGEEHVVEALLQAGASVNLQRIGGATPLHLAIIAQHPLIIAKLLHANADPEKILLVKRSESDEDGWALNALEYASLKGLHMIVEHLLSHGVHPSIIDDFGASVLYDCGSLGFFEVIRTLIEAGVSVDAQDASGQIPLSMAIQYNHRGAAEILMRLGANATLPSHDGWTPLDIAVSNGNIDLAQLLISNGVGFGQSLFRATLDGRVDMVDLLIRSGAKVEDQDGFGRTPLFIAVAEDGIEVAMRLVNAKTPLNHADIDGKTALFSAVASGHTSKMARCLLEAGADPNWHDSMGMSPMVYAACAGELDILELLREFGAVPPRLSTEAQSHEYPAGVLDLFEEL